MSINYLTRTFPVSADIDGAGSGGTEVTSGGYKYHTFTSSGTFTVTQPGKFEILLVGGGGSGGVGIGGGGGAGGVFQGDGYLPKGDYTVVIGAGAASVTGYPTVGLMGGVTSVGNFVTIGGGGGGAFAGSASADDRRGGDGGSGGGHGAYDFASSNGIALISSHGNDGEAHVSGTTGGGGGGAGEAGGTDGTGYGGDGTAAYDTWLSATSQGVDESGTRYIGGGGAGGNSTTAGAIPGGLGGGGANGWNTTHYDGVANTGGGGGGTRNFDPFDSGAGGSGLVIIRYAV